MRAETPEPNRPHGLLAALVPSGILRQPEVAVTTGIWWLLGLDGASTALDDLVARNHVAPSSGEWRQELRGADGGRTDLEYLWGNPLETHVVVEAKLGHLLTPDQVAGYATRFGENGGLLVVLVPASRLTEARRVIDQCRDSLETTPLHFDVWTYDEVMSALDRALPSSPDLAQLNGLVQAHGALDVAPFTEAELLESNATRRGDVWRVVDAASFGIGGTRWPSGSDGSLEQRRYVTVGAYAVGLAAGVGRKPRTEDGTARPWAWIRVGGTDSYGRLARQVLAQRSPDVVTEVGSDSWLPLAIPTGVFGSEAVEQVRADLEALAAELGTAMAEAINQELAHLSPDDQASAARVLGIPPLHTEDLFTDSDTRRDDIYMVKEAARPLYGGRIWPELTNDPDYQLVRYIPIRPYGANLATVLGPRNESRVDGAPQRWAWLRVHQDTPHAELLGFQALEQVAPGRVERDPHGRVVAIDIPTGVGGPEMLVAIREQIHHAMTQVRRVLAEGAAVEST